MATNSFQPYEKRKLDGFKRVYKEYGSYDFMSQVPYLYDLAEYYEKRFEVTAHWIDAVKAHGLYNACMSREDNVVWARRAFHVQTLYWNRSVNISFVDQQKITANLKKKLERTRQIVKASTIDLDKLFREQSAINDVNELNVLSEILRENMPIIMQKSNQLMVEAASSIIQHAADLVAADKTFRERICVVGFGSIAREEATPYSDLEFMFLIPDSGGADKLLYERLAVTSYFLIINLGEAPLKYFDIEELTERKWFSDKTRSGFKFDGLQEKAGHIPTGNKYVYDKMPNYYIVTVDEMVERYKTVYLNPDPVKSKEGDLSTMLSSLAFIYGDKSLLNRLREQILKIPTSQKRDFATKGMLTAHIDKFNLRPDNTLRELKDVKKDIFRFSSLISFDLKLYFKMSSSKAMHVFAHLQQTQKISQSLGNSLQTLHSAAQYMRQASYSHHNAQCEDVTVSSITHVTSKARTPWSIPKSLLSLFLVHLMPVRKQISDSLDDMSVLLEERQQLFTQALAIAKYYCGDHKEFLKLIKLSDMSLSFEAVDDIVEMKIISLINCSRFDEGEKALNGLMTTGHISEHRRARLHQLQSELYQQTGKLGKALENGEKSKYILEKIYADNEHHPDLALSYQNLAHIYNKQGHYKKALDCYEKVLSIRLRAYGNTDHFLIGTSYNSIGGVYQNQGDYKKALHSYEKAILVCKKICGHVDHPFIAQTYTNIATIYQELADYKKALDYHESSLLIFKEVYGDVDHPHMALSYNHIGTVYYRQGDYNRALDNYEKSLSMFKNVYGDVCHPDVASPYNNIASIRNEQGQFTKAIDNYEKALSVLQSVYGDSRHPDIAATYNNIAAIQLKQNDYQKASYNLERALSTFKTIYNKADHPQIAISYCNIGAACQNQGDNKNALENYEKALSSFKKIYGDVDHPHIASLYGNIAGVYSNLGDSRKSLEYYEKCLSAFRKVYGSVNQPHIARLYDNIATLYDNQGRYQEALHSYENALSIRLKIYGGVIHRDIASSYNRIAAVYEKQGDSEKALENYQKCLFILNTI